jgi:hypothetical protein
MLKRTPAIGLTLAITVGMLTGCGGSSTTSTPGNGSLIALVGDVPLCNVISFTATISDLALTSTSGAQTAHVLPAAASFKINLATLRDFSTILYLNAIPANTYSKATLSIASAQMALYDPTQNPPVTTRAATLTNTTPTYTFEPALTVTKGGVSALRIDFDMVKSIQLDANGQVTGNVTPVFTITPLTASGSEGFGEMDDMVGFVRSVSTTPSTTTPQFTGNLLMQLFSNSLPSGAALTVNFTTATQLFGAADLSHLLTDSFLEVDGYFDVRGNLVANAVEVEEQENPAQNTVALIGLVTSLTKDTSGNLTGFDLWVRQEEPDDSVTLFLDSIVSVSISSSTTYHYSSRSANFASLTFGPNGLALGQEVVVHGPFTVPPTPGSGPAPPTTVAASAVYLKLQSIQGSFTRSVQVGSDDKTGAFWFSPCCPLFQGSPILVLSNGQTTFANLSGLSALSPQPSLAIKGLPFFEPTGENINGVTVPPGTLVMLAKQVHQLQ